MHSRPNESQARGARAGRDTRESLRDALLVTHIEGMHCHRCEEAIVRAVCALNGVCEVEVDFASGQASVIFDPRKVATHQVIAAIEAAGYPCPDAAFPVEAPPSEPEEGAGSLE